MQRCVFILVVNNPGGPLRQYNTLKSIARYKIVDINSLWTRIRFRMPVGNELLVESKKSSYLDLK